MFKFNFFENQSETTDLNPVNEKIWREAEKHVCSFELSNKLQDFDVNVHKYGNIEIKSYVEADVIDYLKQNGSESVLKAEFEHSDLITAEYEGGLKIWECTIDLINYLVEQDFDFGNKKVLDLGSGCGILGIYCLLKGAFVDFQDYNKEVIENITIPNVILNSNKEQFEKCNYFSGDWKSLQKLLNNENYDYILTSETIYNQENYEKLLNIFSKNLKPNGIVFLAAKTYYFGVGGGTREFEKTVKKYEDLKCSVCWKCNEGLQREIIKIIKI